MLLLVLSRPQTHILKRGASNLAFRACCEAVLLRMVGWGAVCCVSRMKRATALLAENVTLTAQSSLQRLDYCVPLSHVHCFGTNGPVMPSHVRVQSPVTHSIACATARDAGSARVSHL